MFLWAFLLLIPGAARPEDHPPPLDQLIANGGFIVTGGTRVLAEHRPDTPFIPASTIKIATALLALQTLGPDFRFKTEFYLRDRTTLVIKGYGDPFLVSESLPPIAKALKQRGLSRIDNLVLDQSYFTSDLVADGGENSENPYDAENAALAVNFNALPLLVHETGRVDSSEPQTPPLPLMQSIGGQLGPGRHRVNVGAFDAQGGQANVDRYAAELLATQFRRIGLEVSARFERGQVEQEDRLIHTHHSDKTVTDLIISSLKYSNNFMANQLFLASGAARFGPPADWRKARKAMAAMLMQCCRIDEAEMSIVEGSGLSRQNRATPASMLGVLRAFSPHRGLLQQRNATLLKSGTLQDVHNYAGYFMAGDSADPFVLFLNQPANTRRELLVRLEQLHRDTLRAGGATRSP